MQKNNSDYLVKGLQIPILYSLWIDVTRTNQWSTAHWAEHTNHYTTDAIWNNWKQYFKVLLYCCDNCTGWHRILAQEEFKCLTSWHTGTRNKKFNKQCFGYQVYIQNLYTQCTVFFRKKTYCHVSHKNIYINDKC